MKLVKVLLIKIRTIISCFFFNFVYLSITTKLYLHIFFKSSTVTSKVFGKNGLISNIFFVSNICMLLKYFLKLLHVIIHLNSLCANFQTIAVDFPVAIYIPT